MMGASHALSGAAAWVAVTATAVPALGLYPLEPSAVLVGALVAAGAALLPDVDHRGATIARSVPFVGRAAAGAVGTLTGGHRRGMHSLLAVIAVLYGTWGLTFLVWTPEGWNRQLPIGSLVIVVAMIAFAVKALKIVNKWSIAWLIGVTFATAVLLWAPHGIAWLPVCIALGYLVHVLGDALTTDGVPLLWPLSPKPPKPIRPIALVKMTWKNNGSFAIPILGTTGSRREWALTLVMTGYLLWGVVATVLLLLRA